MGGGFKYKPLLSVFFLEAKCSILSACLCLPNPFESFLNRESRMSLICLYKASFSEQPYILAMLPSVLRNGMRPIVFFSILWVTPQFSFFFSRLEKRNRRSGSSEFGWSVYLVYCEHFVRSPLHRRAGRKEETVCSGGQESNRKLLSNAILRLNSENSIYIQRFNFIF